MSSASALPGGRTWIPPETLKVNSHAYMFPSGLELNSSNELRLYGTGILGPGQYPTGFVWTDSAWSVRWVHRHDSFVPRLCLGASDRELYVWRSFDELPFPLTPPYYFLIGGVSGDSLALPDTLARTNALALSYAGATSPTHEWAAIWDQGPLRIFNRRIGERWRERQLDLNGDTGVAIGTLDDSTAIVVTGAGRVRSALLTPSQVSLRVPDVAEGSAGVAPLRSDGEGGYWVVWSAYFEHAVAIRRLADGTWTAPDTLSADFVDGPGNHVGNTVAVSQDPSPRPAISWMTFGRDGVERIYVSWPTEGGWTRAEFLPGSEKGGAQQLIRDENGDIWIAWWKQFDGIFWTHSHATATSSEPVITERDRRPYLRWTLSAPAEGTWWAVLRASDGEYEPVARLRAGTDVTMTWADTSAPSGVTLRYAIRRECRDARYRWTSGESRWEPRGPVLTLLPRSANPTSARLELEVLGANAGALSVRLFDLQGREVAKQTLQAAGAGRDAVVLPLGASLPAGLYLLHVRAADGRVAPAAKIAVVR